MFVSKQGQPQPLIHSKNRNTRLKHTCYVIYKGLCAYIPKLVEKDWY